MRGEMRNKTEFLSSKIASFMFLMSANNDDNLFMFNTDKLPRKEASLLLQTSLYIYLVIIIINLSI